MMRNSTFLLLLCLAMYVHGFKTSSTCANFCNAESSIKCDRPCNLDINAISALRFVYGRRVVDTCTTACDCDKHEYVYPADEVCKIVQSFAIRRSSEDCKCKHGTRVWNDDLPGWKIQKPASLSSRDAINYLISRKVGLKIQNHLRLRAALEETTVNPWEKWCKHKCAEGLGGSACYCDIIP